MEKKYSPNDDYCEDACRAQSVRSTDEVLAKHPEYNEGDVAKSRTNYYSCADNYEMGTIQDNHIYISTNDMQHDQICDGKTPEKLSGYFSDQATVEACSNNGTLDNTAYNEACQIQPWREDGINGSGEGSYKPHVDCFEINHDRLEEVYGTRDFNAAIGQCEANNQFGSGGGNQGYNPHISEMIGNGCLEHRPEKSFSDSSISESKHPNAKQLNNSVVSEADYNEIMADAKARTDDCIKNNTPHPSDSVCENTGVDVNKNLVDSKTGHATPVEDMSCLYGQSEGLGKDPISLQTNEDMSCLYGNDGGASNTDNLDLGNAINGKDYGVSV